MSFALVSHPVFGSRVRTLMLSLIVLNVVLVTAVIAAFPQVIGGDRTFWIVADFVLLVVYAAWLLLAHPPVTRSVVLGGAAGLVQVADVAREYLTAWPSGLLVLALLVTVGCFAAAGARLGARQGAVQGAHAAVAAMLLLWALAWALNAIAPDQIGAALSTDPDYLRSGLRDMHAYIVWNTLSAAFSHALLLPLMGASAGAAAGAVMRGGVKTGRRPTG